MEEKKNAGKKKIFTAIFFLIVNVAVLTTLILSEDKSGNIADGKEVFSLLKKNYAFAILAVSMYFIILAGDVAVFFGLLKRMEKPNALKIAVPVSVLGRYYDRVTPWSMGGEPFQMGYLISRGVGAGDGCAVTMSRHIIRFSVTAVAVIAILASSAIATTVWVMVAAVLSVLGGLVVPTFMLVCAAKPKIGFAIGRGVLRFGQKLRLVKDYEKAEKKMLDEVEKFLTGIRFLSGNKGMIVLIGICGLIEMFAYNSAPFFVLRALDVELDFWRVFVLCLYVNYAASFAPTPGGSGLAELSFYAIFASYVGGGQLFWTVLFWRISVFYIPVFIGFVFQTVLSVKNLVSGVKERKLSPSREPKND